MIGFIGAGAMGTAIMRGILTAGVYRPGEIFFSRRNMQAGSELANELGVHYIPHNIELVRALGASSSSAASGSENCTAPVLILAVKPAHVPQVLDEIRTAMEESPCILVSIAAGLPLASIENRCAQHQPVVRAMPNVAVSIRHGITAVCAGSSATNEHVKSVAKIFDAVGTTIKVAEKDFSAFTAIAGSSPAWTLQYIDSLARGALDAGMPKDIALHVAAQAVAGTAQLALKKLNEHIKPQELIDAVTSPAGTTIAGLIAAEERGFSSATVAAVHACIDRDTKLAAEK